MRPTHMQLQPHRAFHRTLEYIRVRHAEMSSLARTLHVVGGARSEVYSEFPDRALKYVPNVVGRVVSCSP